MSRPRRTSRPVLPVNVAEHPCALVEPLLAAIAGGPAVLPVPGAGPDGLTVPDDSTALVVTTSGSTGAPKRVLLSGRALTAAARAATTRLGGPGHWLLATPAHYIGGIGVLLRAALSGTEVIVTDRGAGFRASRFAGAVGRLLGLSGRRYTSLVPTQLARVLAEPAAVAAARELDALLIGGAPLTDELRARARDAGLRVIGAYGLTETAGGCVYDGRPLDGVRVRLTGASRVEIAGPSLATGYLGRPGPLSRGGWLPTSDLGVLRDGLLRVTGRADDMIITGGVKVAPEETEAVLRSMPGVAEVCVLGVDDPEWGQRVTAVVVPVDRSAPPDIETLRTAVRERLDAAATPRRVIFADSLPLRGAGKIDRATLRETLSTQV